MSLPPEAGMRLSRTRPKAMIPEGLTLPSTLPSKGPWNGIDPAPNPV